MVVINICLLKKYLGVKESRCLWVVVLKEKSHECSGLARPMIGAQNQAIFSYPTAVKGTWGVGVMDFNFPDKTYAISLMVARKFYIFEAFDKLQHLIPRFSFCTGPSRISMESIQHLQQFVYVLFIEFAHSCFFLRKSSSHAVHLLMVFSMTFHSVSTTSIERTISDFVSSYLYTCPLYSVFSR